MPQIKSLAGVAAKTRPFAVTFSPCERDGANRGAAGFGHAAQRLFDDVGQASALVAGRGVGAAIGGSGGEIIVVPLHFANQRARHVGRCGARRQQMNGVANFGDFGEHDGGSGAHQKIGRGAHGGIAGDAGEGVAAAALQADDEIGSRARFAAAAIENFASRFSAASHDRGDHFGEAAVILQANHVRRFPARENRC